MKDSSIIFVISAASGTGKTTLLSRLLKEEKHISQIITHTTRPMRPGEISGEDYFFVSKENFEDLKNNKKVKPYHILAGNLIDELFKDGGWICKEEDKNDFIEKFEI